ncbi:MAG: DUF222 domain-containing protein [Micropruina sp.]|nr:DUF222 domain-containing protein [Micropruina sp.]
MDGERAVVGAESPLVSLSACSPAAEPGLSLVGVRPDLVASTETVSDDAYGSYVDEALAGIGAELPPVSVSACSSTEDAVEPVVDVDPGIVDGEPWPSAAPDTLSDDAYVGDMDGARAEVGVVLPAVWVAVGSSTAGVLGSVSWLLDGIDHAARGGVGHRERLGLVEQAMVVADRVSALVGVLVAEAEVADSATIARGTPLSSWIGLAGRTSAKAAAGLVFTGRDLVGRPGVRDAVLAGRIGVPQARTIAKVLSQLPVGVDASQELAAEGLLLGHAEVSTPEELAALVPGVVEQVCPELVEDREDEQVRLAARAKRARARRGLSFHADGDGSVAFRGSLPELDAAPFITLIDAYVESDRRAARDLLDPLAEVRTSEQRRADGLIAVLAAPSAVWVGSPPGGGSAQGGGDDRSRICGTGLSRRVCWLPVPRSGRVICVVLCCDADLMPVVLGGNSEVLDRGRPAGWSPPRSASVVAARWWCVFPGCDAPDSRCDAHHLRRGGLAGGQRCEFGVVVSASSQAGRTAPVLCRPPPDRWQIRLDQYGLPEVIPPRRVDPDQKPMRRTRKGDPARPGTLPSRTDDRRGGGRPGPVTGRDGWLGSRVAGCPGGGSVARWESEFRARNGRNLGRRRFGRCCGRGPSGALGSGR